jgi:hypothetical protein
VREALMTGAMLVWPRARSVCRAILAALSFCFASATGAQTVESRFEFGGFRMPLSDAEMQHRVRGASCHTDRTDHVTLCTARSVRLSGPDSGVYDISWEVPRKGHVQAVTFTIPGGRPSVAALDALERRWGSPESRSVIEDYIYARWSRLEPGAKWGAGYGNLAGPGKPPSITLTDNDELRRFNLRLRRSQ